MDLFREIDWVGDDGRFERAGRRVDIQRIGPDIYAISEADDPDEDPERDTLVGAVAVDYWLRTWIAGL